MSWIGGPPGAGKSTVARRIARRHGLRWYNADAHTWEHRDRALQAGNRAAQRWEAMTPEERRTAAPAELLAMSLHAERGSMVVDDLRRLPESPLIVAEGTPISPSLISLGVADPARAVWFMRTRPKRHGVHGVVAEAIEREIIEHAAPTLVVDESRGVDETVAAVEERFAEALAQGPCAKTPAERQALLRYANDAIVSQCLAYLARPWSTGDPETLVRAFVCECEDRECDALVELPIAALTQQRPLAPGHERVRFRGCREPR